MKSILALSFWILLNTCLLAQSRGVINCHDRESIPAWEMPGSIVDLRQLSCGQSVVILGVDRGYVKVQIFENLLGYVEARYVQSLENQSGIDSTPKDLYEKSVGLPQTQEQQIQQREEQPRMVIQPPPPPPPFPTGTQKAAKSGKSDEGKQRRHEAGLYFDLSHIYYGEKDFMRNTGMMWGVSGDYTYRPNKFMLKADARFSFGSVDYWSNGTGTASDLRDYNFETRFTLGYDLGTSDKASFTPFIGLGYRYLFDGEGGTQTTTGAYDYDRKSNYLYSPIGMEAMFRLGRSWSLGVTGEYDLFWHGWQYSELEKAKVGLVPLKNDQNDGWGVRSSVKIIKRFGKIDFAIEPYFRYWDIKESDIDVNITGILGSIGQDYVFVGYPAIEPKNSTMEWGAKIGIRF
jgi:hypothetical protein